MQTKYKYVSIDNNWEVTPDSILGGSMEPETVGQIYLKARILFQKTALQYSFAPIIDHMISPYFMQFEPYFMQFGPYFMLFATDKIA